MVDIIHRPRILASLHVLGGLWRQHPRYAGCLAHWPMVDNGGTTVYDIAGGGNYNGTLTNMDPTNEWVTTPERLGLDFDGTNDYVTYGDVLSTTSRTYSCWIKTPDPNSTSPDLHGCMMSKWQAGGTQAILWFQTADNLAWGDTVSARLLWAGGATAASDNAWHHVCATRDGTNGAIYFDGASKATGTGFVDQSSSVAFFVGAYNPVAPTGRFPGIIADVRVYDRALTAAEAYSLYDEPWLEFTWAAELLMSTPGPEAAAVASSGWGPLVALRRNRLIGGI